MGDDVLEQVRLLGLLFEIHDVDGAKRLQMFLHFVQSAEFRVDADQRRRAEHASDNARHLERAPRGLPQHVDAA